MNAISPFFRWGALTLSVAVMVGGLSACAPMLVGGAFLGTIKMATDRRTSETQLVDEAIELRAFNRLRESLGERARIHVTSFGRRVLLVGEVPTAEDRALAERAVASVDNVLRVINELKVMPVVPLGQRSEDIVITTKIRAQILEAKDLVSNAFKITTNRGVVYLMGIVTDREAQQAIQMARTTQGVKQVVNMVDLISEAELARIQIGQRQPSAAPTTATGTATATATGESAPVTAPATAPVTAPSNAVPAPATNIAPGQPL
jgi:osmotically-inducible protein OsmY